MDYLSSDDVMWSGGFNELDIYTTYYSSYHYVDCIGMGLQMRSFSVQKIVACVNKNL